MHHQPPKEREPGPIWGGWWLWEPPPNKTREDAVAVQAKTKRPRLVITNHAIKRWQVRIEKVSDVEAAVAIVAAIASAKDKHFVEWKLKKETFYIPTAKAMLVGSKGKIVTVLERDPNDLRD